MAIEQARLLTLKTAWLIDNVGAKGARTEIAAIKVIAPRVCCEVIDRAIQVHGGAGVSDDFPLASMYAHSRTLRIADGPDAVHVRSVAGRERDKYVQRSSGPRPADRPSAGAAAVDDHAAMSPARPRVRWRCSAGPAERV